jgi:ATP-dependent DNA ligase
MPVFRRQSAPAPRPEPSAWLPQPFGRLPFRSVKDPLIEPRWNGVRVLARAQRDPSGATTVLLTDEIGVDCTEEFATLAQAVAAALLAEDAILDGYLTVEATQQSVGVMPDGPKPPTQNDIMAQAFTGRHGGQRPERKAPHDPERPIAFVAVDLLRVDGSSLVDLPLLERKRLLEGALEVGELVRVTPFVRTPVGAQARTWFAQGFREMAYKPANGRYSPTGKPGDWATAPIRSS